MDIHQSYDRAHAVKVRRKDVEALIQATFPEYTGRKFKVVVRRAVVICGLNWGGGSRTVYRACTLEGESLGGSDKYNAQAPWANQGEGKMLELVVGNCVVAHEVYAGKDMGLTFYVAAENMGKFLEVAVC